ncbi:MAG: Tex family protein [Negativicutes bacterium]
MKKEDISALIAKELAIRINQVEAVIGLLDEGNTMPFIARYRKEATGELDETQIRTCEERLQYLRNFIKRQEEIIASIEEQGKMTDELLLQINACTKLIELEDLYLPYKQKKRTRAIIARERGLEPFALTMLAQEITTGDIVSLAEPYINPELGVNSAEDAIQGAMDIIAETISDNANFRSLLRDYLWQHGLITAEMTVAEDLGKDFLNYKEFSEPLKQIPSHRILAINRGETKEMLKLKISTAHETLIELLCNKSILRPSIFETTIREAIADAYKRLIFPALEREIRSALTDKAEAQAINVFSRNLRQLLLQAPLSGHSIIGLDPGYRTGCKVAVINPQGAVLAYDTIYVTMSDDAKTSAKAKVLKLIAQFGVSLITIGNGTASFETEQFVSECIAECPTTLHYLIVNEAGASVYSASVLAKEELPDLDVSIRGAVSIARRIQDPLAELVKIDPKSIGVGQYQHDVNQKELAQSLQAVVESSVNHVGVELNTASSALLSYVSGINSAVAKNIVKFRTENGSFSERKQLLKVARLGPAAFVQCAGFLRVASSGNPLDNTSVHPESYKLAETILVELGYSLKDLKNKDKITAIQQAATGAEAKIIADKLAAGEPTVRDILQSFSKPGRDPREDMPAPQPRKNITNLSDIQTGSLVTGTVHNITDFGVFVDIGVKINGLIHKSELSYKRFNHALDIVSIGDIVECLVLGVDEARKRIALSLKQARETKPAQQQPNRDNRNFQPRPINNNQPLKPAEPKQTDFSALLSKFGKK